MKVYISENKKEHHPSEQQQREMWLESKLVCHKVRGSLGREKCQVMIECVGVWGGGICAPKS
jgi:hypothetical protein